MDADSQGFLSDLIADIEALGHEDYNELNRIKHRMVSYLKRLGPEAHSYIEQASQIQPYSTAGNPTYDERVLAWQEGKKKLIRLLVLIKEDTRFHTRAGTTAAPPEAPTSNDVFVVHGHDDEMKEAVARTLTVLGLDPIILHEKPNKGLTIIEKFSEYAKVGYAVVCLSPDDIGYAVRDGSDAWKFRARQNVLLELGYFLGKLGREQVLVLHKPAEKFEMPSDYSGVLFQPFDKTGNWRLALAKELHAFGYRVDANKLLSH